MYYSDSGGIILANNFDFCGSLRGFWKTPRYHTSTSMPNKFLVKKATIVSNCLSKKPNYKLDLDTE